jgi:hypothetical protein
MENFQGSQVNVFEFIIAKDIEAEAPGLSAPGM